MLRVCINCYGVTTSDSVYQWDLNHTIAISGVDTSKAIALHFCNKKSTEAIVVPTTIDGDVVTAPIPNVLLQEPHNVIAYLHTTSNDESKTIEIIHIPVIARVKPSEYEFTDNEDIYNFEMLDGRITDYINSSETRYSEFTEEINGAIDEFKAEVDEKLATGEFEKLDEHIADTNNPHQVTKDQVGLSNVDNTSDADKPVSTAQRTAIDGAITTAEYRANNSTIAKLVAQWKSDVEYAVGDIVSVANGLVYKALVNNTNNNPITYDGLKWEQIYLGDVVGEHHRELEYIVERWNKLVGYAVGDFCSHKGVVYKCIAGNSSVEPPNATYWEVAFINRIIESIGKVTTVTGEKISVPSNASGSTTLASATFKKGIYLVVCSVSIPGTNSTGIRRINLLTSPDTPSASLGVTSSCAPLQGATQSLQITSILNVTTDDTTYYLNAQQTSGATIDDCQGQIRAVRII